MVLYRPGSDHARKVEDFARDFSQVYRDKKLDLVSLNTRDGASTATLYDVMQYPAVLALQDNGQVIQEWEGEMLPRVSEVAHFANA